MGHERVFLDWLVYALGQLAVVVLGWVVRERLGFWDVGCRSVGVYRVGVLVWLAWLGGGWLGMWGGGWGRWGECGRVWSEVNSSDVPLSAVNGGPRRSFGAVRANHPNK